MHCGLGSRQDGEGANAIEGSPFVDGRPESINEQFGLLSVAPSGETRETSYTIPSHKRPHNGWLKLAVLQETCYMKTELKMGPLLASELTNIPLPAFTPEKISLYGLFT